MMPWQAWRGMAQDSERAARLAEADGCLRSAASRCYYAAYQAATALLLYRGLTPPQDREAWSHTETPELVAHECAPVMRSRDTRVDLRRRLRNLYALRVRADYQPSRGVSTGDVAEAGRDARYLPTTISSVLPEGKQQ